MQPNQEKTSLSSGEGPEAQQKKPDRASAFQRPTRSSGIEPKTGTSQSEQKLKYPKAVFFIASNELCERFAYYGVNTIMALYLKNQLDFSDNTATVIFHVYIMCCFLFTLMGAIIADSWLGKYRTILYLSIVYAVGDTVVTLSAIPGVPAVVITMIGLSLIAIGAGSIKPCVSAFGGDQFILPQQENYLKKFFSLFYFTINAGSFVSTLLTPILREVSCFDQKTCYSLGFGIPTIFMISAIVIFFTGTKHYIIKRPAGNVIVKVVKCIGRALRKREKTDGHWLDKASDKYDPAFIEDIKVTLRILVLYIPLPFFWALFDQQGSRWTFQASRMNGEIGGVEIQPDQMQVVNPVLILAFIPLFEGAIYPLLTRCNLLKKPLQRLTVGGFLAALSFVVSAIVELKLEETYAVLPQPGEAQMRLYNTLPQNLNVKFLDPLYDPVSIPSMDFWKKYDIPAEDEAKVKIQYTAQGTEKTETLSVFENSLTSYIITADRSLQIRNDDADKSKSGDPKLMIVYTEATKETKVKLVNCKVPKEITVSKAQPYSEYEEVPNCNHYGVLVDGKGVMEKVVLKQGGVYLIFITGAPGAHKGYLLNVIAPNSVHMLWLVPQYVLITAGEVMFSITGLEFSFTQAPMSMKSLMQAAWLMTIAVGNMIVAVVAQASLFDRQIFEFLLFACLMTIDMVIFMLMTTRYKYVENVEPATDAEGETTTEKKQ